MLLVKKDLLDLKQQGLFSITTRSAYGDFSLDLHIGKVFDSYHHERRCNSGFDLYPQHSYFWKPRERLYLAKSLMGEITSRSMWARKGLRTLSATNHLFYQEYRGRPLCLMQTMGTTVHIQEGDALAQLIVREHLDYEQTATLQTLVEQGEICFTSDGTSVIPVMKDNAFQLTRARTIWVYKQGEFLEQEITTPLTIPKGTFFLSLSQEAVALPFTHVGHVREITPRPSLTGGSPLLTHANSPYIAPKSIFQGQIMFENYTFSDYTLVAGMPQGELELEQLSSPLVQGTRSQFFGQDLQSTKKVLDNARTRI